MIKKIDDILARLPLKTRTVIVDQMSSSDSETSKNLPNYDQSVCQSLIDHLKKQKAKNSASFHKLLYELFDEKLQDSIFICWLARKLSIEVIQLLRSQKMTKIWTPRPPLFALVRFW